jgi:molecular chaperone DnaK
LKEEDQKKRALVDARNEADHLVYQTEKNIKEYGEKLDPGDIKKLENGIEDVKNALKGDQADSIKSTSQKLNNVWQEVAQRMYQSASSAGQGAEAGAGAGAGPGFGPGAGPGGEQQAQGDGGSSGKDKEDDKVVDADYEIIDDEKK